MQDPLMDRPVTLRPRGLLPGDVGRAFLVGVGVVIGSATAAAAAASAGGVVGTVTVTAVVAPVGEGGSRVRRGWRAAIPVHAEVVVLVAYEEQRSVAVALLLVAIHAVAGLSLPSATTDSIRFD